MDIYAFYPSVNVFTFKLTCAFHNYLMYSHIFTHSTCHAVLDSSLKIHCLSLSSGRHVSHCVTSMLLWKLR